MSFGVDCIVDFANSLGLNPMERKLHEGKKVTDQASPYVKNLSLAAFVLGVFQHKKLIAVLIIASFILAVLWLRSKTPLYEVNLVLSPAESTGKTNDFQDGRAISSFLKLGKQNAGTEIGRLLYLITSERLVKHLNKEINLVEKIYGPIDFVAEENWVRKLVRGLTKQPSPREAVAIDVANWLRMKVRVREVQDTDLTELKLLHSDPEEGKKLLLTLYNGADNILRAEALAQSQARTEYLKALIPNVDISEYRNTLLSLLMEQEKKIMLLQDGSAYAAKILDGPQASSNSIYPNYTLTLVLSPLIAIVATIIIIILTGWIKELHEVSKKK